MAKKCKKALQDGLVEYPMSKEDREREHRWQTESDYRTLKEFQMIKKDPARHKRLLAYMKEEADFIQELSEDAFLAKIGLKKEA